MTTWDYLTDLWVTYSPSIREWAYQKGFLLPMLLMMALVIVVRWKKRN